LFLAIVNFSNVLTVGLGYVYLVLFFRMVSQWSSGRHCTDAVPPGFVVAESISVGWVHPQQGAEQSRTEIRDTVWREGSAITFAATDISCVHTGCWELQDEQLTFA